MVIRTIFLVVAFSSFLVSARGDTEVNVSDSSKSEFEELVSSNGTLIPRPYPKLLEYLGQFYGMFSDRLLGGISTTAVPDGRSLFKGFADLNSPRLVTALTRWTQQVGERLQGAAPLFIAYPPRSDALEVISWNRHSQKYDFLIVATYKSNPKIVNHHQENLCIRCHQHGGPIWARGAWQESALNKEKFFQKIHLEPEFKNLVNSSGGGTDPFVRMATSHLQAVRVCQGACGNDLECKRKLLLAMLTQKQTGANPALATELADELRTLTQAHWPDEEYSYRSDVLPDRDPFSDTANGGTIFRVQIQNLSKFLDVEESAMTPLERYQFEAEYKSGVELTYNVFAANLGDDDKDIPGIKILKFPYKKMGSLGQPELLRPLVGGIPHHFSGSYLLEHVVECFEISKPDENLLKTKTYSEIKKISEDDRTGEFLKQGPLTPERAHTYIRERFK